MISHKEATKLPAHKLLVFVLITATLLTAACKTPPTINPFDVTDQKRPSADFLDTPVNRSSSNVRRNTTNQDNVSIVIPTASTNMSRTIDADSSDWDLSRARTYKTKADIEFGRDFWTGPNDASFRVALHADENYMYFLIDVIDDNVIQATPQNPIDAVRIWLRDLQLEQLSNQLPETYQQQSPLRYDTAITITPDGASHVETPGGTQQSSNVLTTAARTQANGYSLEVAIALEALPQVSSLPLNEIAFRVELLDGDDPSRKGPQTLLSMLPDIGQKSPRFAIYGTELRPHIELAATSASQNLLGAWHQVDGTWQFESLEAATNYWTKFEELPSASTLISDTDALPQICREARNDIVVLEAYQSTNRQNVVALLLCGPTPETGQCSPSSTSQAIWTHLTPANDTWTVQRTITVFENPLTQCGLQEATNQPVTRQFSMTPLSAISPSLWAVGWQNSSNTSLEHIDSTGITLIDAQSSTGRVGELHPQRVSATQQRRTIRNSQIFFMQIDDNPGLDVCEIELSEDQECSDFNTACTTPEHSTNTLCLIKTWNDKARKYEPYLFTKHKRCTPTTRFEHITGYMLLYINQRFALLPSNRSR